VSKRLVTLRLIGGVLVAALLTGCEQGLPSASKTGASGAPSAAAEQTVRLVRPERKTVLHPFEQPGFNIEPFQETSIYARITGYVQKWNADIGDYVKEGQILAVLHVPEMEVEVLQKQAAVRQAAAQVAQAKAAILTDDASSGGRSLNSSGSHESARAAFSIRKMSTRPSWDSRPLEPAW
jgi:multidrug efflux pump subunit AcrA (membrane-fusion protein)